MERGGGGEVAALRLFSVWGRAARLHRRGLCDDGGHAAAGGDCATVPDAIGGGAAGRGAGKHYTAAEECDLRGVGGARGREGGARPEIRKFLGPEETCWRRLRRRFWW